MLIACGLSGYGVCNNQCRVMGTSTDCRTCGDAVPTGGSCFNGNPICPGGETVCNGNSAHCGACNTPVPTGQVCTNGAPACQTAGHTYCAAQAVCANLQTSSSHCGMCGVSVAAPRICRNGAPACPGTGDTFCSTQNACANLQTSSAHCGMCGNAVTRGCSGGYQVPNWTSVLPFGPQQRTGAAMTFDANRNLIVLFGGNNASTFFDETWTWNGTTWTQLIAAASLRAGPPACAGTRPPCAAPPTSSVTSPSCTLSGTRACSRFTRSLRPGPSATLNGRPLSGSKGGSSSALIAAG